MKIKDFVLKNKVKISITIFLCVIASILLYIFFIIILLFPVFGILYNLVERLKEIKKGEEDEASKY